MIMTTKFSTKEETREFVEKLRKRKVDGKAGFFEVHVERAKQQILKEPEIANKLTNYDLSNVSDIYFAQYEIVTEFLKKHDCYHVLLKGATKKEIELFEQLLDIKLPSAFVDFLTIANGGKIGQSLELRPINEDKQEIKKLNKNDIITFENEKYLIFTRTNYGDDICLKLENKDKGKVIQISHETGGVGSEYDNFIHWIYADAFDYMKSIIEFGEFPDPFKVALKRIRK